MTEGFSDPIIGGGGGLVYPSIHSPNFSAGPPIVGWSIDKNGDAFFSGTVGGNGFIINKNGAFFYSSTPAANNMILSITDSAGTDDEANVYLDGTTSYDPSAGTALRWQGGQFFSYSGTEHGGWTQTGDYLLEGGFAVIPVSSGQTVLFGGLGVLLTIFKILGSQVLISATSSTASTPALLEVQGAVAASGAVSVTVAAGSGALQIEEPGDTHPRFLVEGQGAVFLGSGSAAVDTSLTRTGVNQFTSSGELIITAGGLTVSAGGESITGGTTTDTLTVTGTSALDGNVTLGKGTSIEFQGATGGSTLLFPASTGQLDINNEVVITAGGLSVTGGETADTIAASSGQAAGKVAVITNTTSSPTDATSKIIGNAAGDLAFGIEVSGDSNLRFRSDTNGVLKWGTGSAAQDVSLQRNSGHLTITATDGNTYDTEVKHVAVYPAQSVSSMSAVSVTGASASVGAAHYRFSIQVFYTTAAVAGTPTFNVTTPSLTGSSFITAIYHDQGSTATGTVGRANSPLAAMGAGITLNGTGGICNIEGDATFSAPGTLQLTALTSASADTFTIFAVTLDLYPVV